MSANYENCPICHKNIEVHTDYKKWCEYCYWNAGNTEPIKANTVFDLIYQRLTEKGGQRLFENLKKLNLHLNQNMSPSLRWAKTLAFLIYFFYGLFFITALGLSAYGYLNNWLLLTVGVFLLLLTYMLWPWKKPKETSTHITINKSSAFGQLIVTLATKMNAPVPDTILLTDEYNASVSTHTLSGKHTLSMGLPLWHLLNNDEKTGVLAHELGHLVNNDPLRNRSVIGALDIIFDAGYLIYPDDVLPEILEGDSLFVEEQLVINASQLITIPIKIVMRGTAKAIWGIGHFMMLLLWAESQEAEYRADLYALKLTGLKTSLSCLKKIELETFFWEYARSHLLKKKPAPLVFEKAYQEWLTLPKKEKQRHERLMLQEKHTIDASHPPTVFRLEMLKAQQKYVPYTPISSPNWQKIDEELRPYTEIIANKVIDTVRNSLYE